MSKKALFKLFDLSGLLIFPILSLLYTWLNTHPREAVNISMPIDDKIPFLSVFIVPYIIWYAFIFGYLFIFWHKNSALYWKTIWSIALGEIICFAIYYFFQTTVPRPSVEGKGMLSALVMLIYSNDEPFNCFPSIHVLTTSLIMMTSFHFKKTGAVRKWTIHTIGALIILSTLFVKQHVFLDLVGGLLIAAGMHAIFFKVTLPSFKVAREKSKQDYQAF
ncbi:PAP2 superfamily protein [Bacillus sp. OV322]|uniref:phosphatase PAP2 family protein n=1 Tax=Bacillus sp. OV322 TaxID=1882764 RepID=UPI0008F253C3|nr:phosphatase PAP2 family protein [Bacillus sp. OV322]SFC26181.1 PAP2 superfamily protein [Bacillus sp. OV322]